MVAWDASSVRTGPSSCSGAVVVASEAVVVSSGAVVVVSETALVAVVSAAEVVPVVPPLQAARSRIRAAPIVNRVLIGSSSDMARPPEPRHPGGRQTSLLLGTLSDATVDARGESPDIRSKGSGEYRAVVQEYAPADPCSHSYLRALRTRLLGKPTPIQPFLRWQTVNLQSARREHLSTCEVLWACILWSMRGATDDEDRASSGVRDRRQRPGQGVCGAGGI